MSGKQDTKRGVCRCLKMKDSIIQDSDWLSIGRLMENLV